MVDRIRNAVWDVSEVGFASCEWSREYDGVNKLPTGQFRGLIKAFEPYSLDTEEHRGRARKCS